MYDVSKIDVEKLGLQAACQEAYDAGRRDSCSRAGFCGFMAGMDAGFSTASCMLEAASTVTNAWFNGDYTILLFGDGKKEKVRWSREPGSVYDREKAIMACILKHALGNGYIHALQEFAVEPAKPAVRTDLVPIDMSDGDEETNGECRCVPGDAVCYGEDDHELSEEGNGPIAPSCGDEEPFEYGLFRA